MDDTCTCTKCGKTMKNTQFYTYKDGTKTELCKKCLTMHIDCFDPETYTWLLKQMDVPYVKEEWDKLVETSYNKDPSKLNGTSIFGKYLSKMRLNQWKDAGWEDTDKIIEEKKQKEEERLKLQRKIEEKALEQLKRGDINTAQYQTLVSVSTQNEKKAEIQAPPAVEIPQFLQEEDLPDPAAELTKEDKLRLAVKWGRLYKPNEWIELEKKYNEMMQSFDIHDSDTIGTLILICKTYLKMNQAIDIGDYQGYQQLARTYDTMRKSAKFTAVQNNVEKENFVDSVGALVAYCEKEGGKIPRYKIETDLDIVDKVIADLKSYTKSLIYEDKSLSQQIEEYLKKREILESMKKDKEEARENGLKEIIVKDEDIQKHYERIEKERIQDRRIIFSNEFN